jgi:hypothetical protein
LILYGAGIAPGTHHSDASPADIAPTLATLLRIEIPSNCMGRTLSEALKAK